MTKPNDDLTDSARAEIAEAVRIVKEDKLYAYVSQASKPKDDEPKDPPTPGPDDPPADDDPSKPKPPPAKEPTIPPKRKGLFWGDQLDPDDAEPPTTDA